MSQFNHFSSSPLLVYGTVISWLATIITSCQVSFTLTHLAFHQPLFCFAEWSLQNVKWIMLPLGLNPAQVPFPHHDSLPRLLGSYLFDSTHFLHYPAPVRLSILWTHQPFSCNKPIILANSLCLECFLPAFAWLALSISIGISSNITFLEKLSFTIWSTIIVSS